MGDREMFVLGRRVLPAPPYRVRPHWSQRHPVGLEFVGRRQIPGRHFFPVFEVVEKQKGTKWSIDACRIHANSIKMVIPEVVRVSRVLCRLSSIRSSSVSSS